LGEKASHERLRLELELHKQRLFVAKAERVDTRQLELEFAQKLRALEQVGSLHAECDGIGGHQERAVTEVGLLQGCQQAQ
jgi:transposase